MKMLKFKEFVDEFLTEGLTDKVTNNSINHLKNLFLKLKYHGERKSKHGAHLRFQFDQDNKKAIKLIEDALKKDKISNYEIEDLQIGDYGNGAKSGEFQTFAIKFTEDHRIPGGVIPKDMIVYVVNSVPQKGIFGGKALSPAGLNITMDVNLTLENLYKETRDKLSIKYSKHPASLNALTSLVDEIYNWSPKTIFDSPYNLKPFEQTIPYSKQTEDYVIALSPTDLNAVGKDFGEILGGLFLLKCIDTQYGVKYPKGNEPLVDFFVDDNIKISSKYKKGAAPTLSGIIANVNLKSLDNPTQKKLYEVLEISSKNGVAEGYLKIAKHLNLPGYVILCKIMKNQDPSINDIDNFVKSVAIKGEDEYDSESFFKLFDEFYQSVNSWPKNKTIDWKKLKSDKRFFGAIVGPLSICVAKTLNEDPIYLESLKALCSMVPINQLYLDFKLKTNLIEFHLKAFESKESEFKFEAPNQSVYNPSNGRLGFSLK